MPQLLKLGVGWLNIEYFYIQSFTLSLIQTWGWMGLFATLKISDLTRGFLPTKRRLKSFSEGHRELSQNATQRLEYT